MAASPLSFSTVPRARSGSMLKWRTEEPRLGRLGSREQIQDARLKRLAQSIDALAEKDERFLRHAREIAALRRAAAAGLYTICSGFVASLNRLLSRCEMVLDPSEFSEDAFQEDTKNLIQINFQGRILQIEFEAAPELVATEDLRIPYTLQGVTRAFNQELLNQSLIEEQLLFYTLEKEKKMWRFFDARTYRSGPFDQEYLISLMERLI
jgi:hypothetical protein